MDLRGAYEDGVIYRREVLAFDDERLRVDLSLAHQQALSLTLAAAIPTKESVPLLIAKAQREALAVAVEAGVPTKDTIPLLLAKATRQAAALAAKAGIS